MILSSLPPSPLNLHLQPKLSIALLQLSSPPSSPRPSQSLCTSGLPLPLLRNQERKGLEARVARLAGEVQRATAEVERLRARAEAAEHRLAAAFERENEPPAAATDASGAASPGLVSSHAVQADSPTADISAGLPPPALSEQGPEAVVTALFARRAHWRLPENADMRTMLGRALEQLSHGMYSQRGQVLSELLQNADDNRYAVCWRAGCRSS